MYYILSIPGTVGISKFCSKSRYKLLSFPFFHFFIIHFKSMKSDKLNEKRIES
ncbi:hypothetical protein M6B38_286300 [Iris pallida]|uniref:Uncharacterized protein n=1 Tax=Iris pallida TaxID=29817 RepID=A0AAX6HYS6_IRIPA|nr:hypothetical protein M6B38_199275 [Iris pallida]KAJ6845687.1 hypothetical protein M6B38_286300 [Iris pallida]